jgi:uncharacterized repeat protein (TIGR01451 family)
LISPDLFSHLPETDNTVRKITLLFCLLIATFHSSTAQTVTIPDANFVNWLTAHIPSAMNGNQMDISSTAVKTLTRMDVENKGIADLTGVEYFPALITLDCGNGSLGGTPNSLTSLPNLPGTLDTLICGNNQLTSLPVLPHLLLILKCYKNKLTNLPALPNSLTELYCYDNMLDSLPALPASLTYLSCGFNHLTGLPTLPDPLFKLDCSANELTTLPALPNSLFELDCTSNLLVSLPSLPNSLINIKCDGNQLKSLPALPASLGYLDCESNQLNNLPALPHSLTQLNCGGNQLTSLPPLPNSLQALFCENNLLATLPTLPDSLSRLVCRNNNITCFPIFPTSLKWQIYFSIMPNPFSCLPNYVAGMDAGTLAYPLCAIGDNVNNPNACPGAVGIVGFTYKDINANCVKNKTDTALINIHELLYDGSNNLLDQTYSAINGIYNFSNSAGTYTVKMDTAGVPFTTQCIHPGVDSTVVLTAGNPLVNNVDFSLICKPGFDIGAQSAIITGWVFPGLQHRVRIMAGDLSHWYHLNCASGISGQVQITVSGPVTYTGIVPGALTPSISGKVFTYTITDFGGIDIYKDFGLIFSTDTTAQVDDWVCINVSVTPTNGDNNIRNNNFHFCYQVINSHDPNGKEVYPTDVLPGYQDWFTYTVHFQNTGNTAAHNIRLVDTLDANLDLSTFQLINYSHKNTVSFQKNELTFRFPNIMLADSTNDEEASIGYVQYRIKPKTGLPAGTKIKNTATIYFDYNPAVITNTTINNFTTTASIKESHTGREIIIYPNPGNGIYHIKLPEHTNHTSTTIQVYDVLGTLIVDAQTQNALYQIDLGNQPNGAYIFRINEGKQFFNQLIIKQ